MRLEPCRGAQSQFILRIAQVATAWQPSIIYMQSLQILEGHTLHDAYCALPWFSVVPDCMHVHQLGVVYMHSRNDCRVIHDRGDLRLQQLVLLSTLR